MARKSKIDALDPRLKAELDKLLSTGRYTLDELLKRLINLGGDPEDFSRSGIGRYAKNFSDVADKLRQTREMSAAFAAELGAVKDTEQSEVLTQMMQTLLMKFQMEKIEDGEDVSSKMLLDVAKAGSAVMQTVAQREKIAEAARAQAARDAGEAARARGLSAEVVKSIERAVLGVET